MRQVTDEIFRIDGEVEDGFSEYSIDVTREKTQIDTMTPDGKSKLTEYGKVREAFTATYVPSHGKDNEKFERFTKDKSLHEVEVEYTDGYTKILTNVEFTKATRSKGRISIEAFGHSPDENE